MNEIGQPPGKNTDLRLAILSDGRAAVAWTNWGWAPPNSGDDGQVFVRVQEANGRWGIAQTVTRTPVNGGVGGVGIAVTISNTIVVAWGDGHGAVWASESTDVGENWSQPAQLGTFAYQVIALHGDTAGGLHLLALTPDPHRLRYLARPAGQTAWQTPVDVPLSGEHFGGDLAVLNLAGGGVRRFIVARLEGSVGLVRSDDGQSWTPIPVELGRYMAEPNPDKVSVMAASRPAGDLVAISWSQYSAGGVFTQISTDGGVSWGREERVAQHQHDGGCYAGAENTEGLPCGYYPSMAYDAASDSLAIGWVEVVRQREPPMRMLLSARRLSEQSGWRFVITPDQPDTPPVLAPWGWQGTLYGTAAGRYTWIVLIDTRNDQNRVGARQIELPAILGEVAS
jgi:hypothetical protein